MTRKRATKESIGASERLGLKKCRNVRKSTTDLKKILRLILFMDTFVMVTKFFRESRLRLSRGSQICGNLCGTIPWAWLCEEKWRLCTFAKYPLVAAKSALLLARSGFVYIGSGKDSEDTVICFFCHGKKKAWRADEDIGETHRLLCCDCAMVKGTGSGNIPLNALNIVSYGQSFSACRFATETDDPESINELDRELSVGSGTSGRSDLMRQQFGTCHGFSSTSELKTGTEMNSLPSKLEKAQCQFGNSRNQNQATSESAMSSILTSASTLPVSFRTGDDSGQTCAPHSWGAWQSNQSLWTHLASASTQPTHQLSFCSRIRQPKKRTSEDQASDGRVTSSLLNSTQLSIPMTPSQPKRPLMSTDAQSSTSMVVEQSPSGKTEAQPRTPLAAKQSPSEKTEAHPKTSMAAKQSPSQKTEAQPRTPLAAKQSPTEKTVAQPKTPLAAEQSPTEKTEAKPKTPLAAKQSPTEKTEAQPKTSLAAKQPPSEKTEAQPKTPLAAKQSPTARMATQSKTPLAAKQSPSEKTEAQSLTPLAAKQPPTEKTEAQPKTSLAAKQPPSEKTEAQPKTPLAAKQSPTARMATQSKTPLAAKQSPSEKTEAQSLTPLAAKQPPTEKTEAQPKTSLAAKQPPSEKTEAQPKTPLAAKQSPTARMATQSRTPLAAEQSPSEKTETQPKTSLAAKQSPIEKTEAQSLTPLAAKQPPTEKTEAQPKTRLAAKQSPTEKTEAEPKTSLVAIQSTSEKTEAQSSTSLVAIQSTSTTTAAQSSTSLVAILSTSTTTAAQSSTSLVAIQSTSTTTAAQSSTSLVAIQSTSTTTVAQSSTSLVAILSTSTTTAAQSSTSLVAIQSTSTTTVAQSSTSLVAIQSTSTTTAAQSSTSLVAIQSTSSRTATQCAAIPANQSSTQSSTHSSAVPQNHSYKELGIIEERPWKCEYALRSSRLRTFVDWPSDYYPTKEDLADAGFYYAGSARHRDRVLCFYCSGGLRNWQHEDDVWVEHARCFPKCGFLRLMMGQKLIDIIERHCRSNYKMCAQIVQAEKKMNSIDSELELLVALSETNDELRLKTLCKICKDKRLATIFLPCGHVVCCRECASSMKDCPICCNLIKRSFPVYF